MSPPSERVSDGDQRRARQIVDAALSSGRIIQADRDKRIEQIDNAQSIDELRMLTHDLDRSAMFGGAIESPMPVAPSAPPAMPPPAAPMPVAPSTTVPYGPPAGTGPSGISAESMAQIEAQVGAAAKKSGRSCLGCLIPLVVVLAVFAGTGFTVYSDVRDAVKDAFDSADNGFPGSGTSASAPADPDADVLSVGGWNDLKAALKAETGRIEAFNVVLYPTYAAVSAPVDASGNHSQFYYWDGTLSDTGPKSTSSTDRFDMDDIRAAAIVRLVTKARKLVDKPSSWYAIVQPPDFESTSIMAYAVNDFGDTVYVSATADGRITRTYDSTKP